MHRAELNSEKCGSRQKGQKKKTETNFILTFYLYY